METMIALGLVGLIPWIVLIVVIGVVLKWVLTPAPPPPVDRRFRHLVVDGQTVRDLIPWGSWVLLVVVVAVVVAVVSHAGSR
jgi:hypothetical protein